MVCFLRKKKWKSRSGFKIETQFISCLHFRGFDLSECSPGDGSAQTITFDITRLHTISVELNRKQKWQSFGLFLNKMKIEEKTNSIIIVLTTDTYSNLLDFRRQDLRKLKNKTCTITNKWNVYNLRGNRGIKLVNQTVYFCQIKDFHTQDTLLSFCSVPIF